MKKRTIGGINYHNPNEVVFVRLNKEGLPQKRTVHLDRDGLRALVRLVNNRVLQRRGWVYVWPDGWSFFAN